MWKNTGYKLSVILCLTYISWAESAIQCYKCLVAQPTYYTNETVRLCKDFDYSDKFIVDCPYSTFCMKKFTSARISGTINGTERDCANQKLETQNHINGQWQAEVHIEEPYEEGCQFVNDKGLRTSLIENCYCKGYLCNSSNNLKYSSIYFMFSVIIVVIVSNLMQIL